MSSTTNAVIKPSDRAWYRSSLVYQIYPASFADHAASGHGTLPGILSKLPYLKSLGVDVIWLSPIYKSPQADMGYDISDYRDIDPRYGTLKDWEEIRDKTHELGMKLVMDLVVNHTSDQHEWFKESRSSLTNPKRDWYIWRKPRIDANGNKQPPNNWNSTFGAGSAWEYDETTDEYYLHLFLKEQPDLNWENPEVRQAVYDLMHWWLKKGSDGFRMDVINFISKAPGLPDAPIVDEGRDYQPFGALSINGPKVAEWLKEMNQEVLSKYDCFAVGEMPGNEAVSRYSPFSHPEQKMLQCVFQFHHMEFDGKWKRDNTHIDENGLPTWKLTEMKKIFTTWQVEMEQQGGWNSNYVENHDQARTITRLTSDHPEDRAKSSKLLAMFHCSLGGTQFVYQGQEIGMCNVPRNWGEEEYKDIEAIQYLEGEREYRRRKTGEKNPDVSDLLQGLRRTARDNGRTPMQWDSSTNAGFSKGTPWMRVHDDYAEGWNAEAQMKDPKSVWHFWQKMHKLRKENDALIYGKFLPIDEDNEEIFAYVRDDPTITKKLLVILNFARGKGRGAETTFIVPTDVHLSGAKLLITNGDVAEGSGIEGGEIKLAPWEGRIYTL